MEIGHTTCMRTMFQIAKLNKAAGQQIKTGWSSAINPPVKRPSPLDEAARQTPRGPFPHSQTDSQRHFVSIFRVALVPCISTPARRHAGTQHANANTVSAVRVEELNVWLFNEWTTNLATQIGIVTSPSPPATSSRIVVHVATSALCERYTRFVLWVLRLV